jgi:hypothetical protein
MAGNDYAGVRRQNAEFGCRMCSIAKTSLDQAVTPVDNAVHARTKFADRRVRAEAATAAVDERKAAAGEKILQKAGIAEDPSPLAMDGFDEFSQLPHDPFHAEYIGMCMLILSWFCRALKATALAELNARLSRMEVPKGCGKLVAWVLTKGSKKSAPTLKLKAQQIASAVQVKQLLQYSRLYDLLHMIGVMTSTDRCCPCYFEAGWTTPSSRETGRRSRQ